MRRPGAVLTAAFLALFQAAALRAGARVSAVQSRAWAAGPAIACLDLKAAGLATLFRHPSPVVFSRLFLAKPPEPATQAAGPADIGKRLGALAEELSAPLQALADPQAGAGSDRAAADQAADTLDSPLGSNAPEDLPPAGPREGLEREDMDWLSRNFVAETAILDEARFDAVVGGEPAAVRKFISNSRGDKDFLANTFGRMHRMLQRVCANDRPDRARLAAALQRRYAAFFQELLADADLPKKDRAALQESLRLYLKPGILVEEFSRQREARGLADKLARLIRPSPPPAAQIRREPKTWNIHPPIPKRLRGAYAGREESWTESYGEILARLKERLFAVEKLIARARLASGGPRFSPSLRERTAAALSTGVAAAIADLGDLRAMTERIAGISLFNAFRSPVQTKRHSIIWIPRNRNLRLVETRDGVLISAVFETDIQDDDAINTFVESIADYWQGDLFLGGRIRRLRTSVAVRKLKPAEAFSQGSLRLVDSRGTTSTGKDAIFLGHDLDYAAAAHEFGHILGLNDDYIEGYRPMERQAFFARDLGGIMSSLEGAVRPWHIRTAYLLLRRHCLERR